MFAIPYISKAASKRVQSNLFELPSVSRLDRRSRSPGLHDCRSGLQLMRLINVRYETSMALVTFSFGSVFGMVMVRMPSSTLAEIWSFTTSSGSTYFCS